MIAFILGAEEQRHNPWGVCSESTVLMQCHPLPHQGTADGEYLHVHLVFLPGEHTGGVHSLNL